MACKIAFLRKVKKNKSINEGGLGHFEAGNGNHKCDAHYGIISKILTPSPFNDDFFFCRDPRAPTPHNCLPHELVNNDRYLKRKQTS